MRAITAWALIGFCVLATGFFVWLALALKIALRL